MGTQFDFQEDMQLEITRIVPRIGLVLEWCPWRRSSPRIRRDSLRELALVRRELESPKREPPRADSRLGTLPLGGRYLRLFSRFVFQEHNEAPMQVLGMRTKHRQSLEPAKEPAYF